jgi:hypothetical protein
MKTSSKSETFFQMVEGINYNNVYGGAYAYLQFLAYTRGLSELLRPVAEVEKQLDAIEGINWLFNECLSANFSHRQKVIFENKMSETKEIFDQIRQTLKRLETETIAQNNYLHQVAA